MRTAHYNGYSTVKSMCAALEIPCRAGALNLLTEQSPLIFELIAAAPEFEPLFEDNIYGHGGYPCRSWLVDDIAVNPVQFSRRLTYCPECLRSEVITIFQDIKGLSVCPIHQCCIISQCPACKALEQWTDANLFQCGCGFDRRNSKIERAKLFDAEQLETFGPKSYITELSRIANVAQIAREFWLSRAPNEEKLNYQPMHELQEHAMRMISAQLKKYPGLTRALHLAPWVSTHPQIEKIAYRVIKTRRILSDDCVRGDCCREIELTVGQLLYAADINKNSNCKTRKMIAEHFESSSKLMSKKYYRCKTPICKLTNPLCEPNNTKPSKKTHYSLNEARKLFDSTSEKLLALEKPEDYSNLITQVITRAPT